VPVDLNKLTSDYKSGNLSGRVKEIAEELGRRGVINIDAPKSGYVAESIPEAVGMGTNVGLIELGLLPVTAMESALKLGNIGLESLGAPEWLRLPVSEKGLAGTARAAGKDLGYTYESLEEVSPRARPFAVGGEVIGGGIVPAAAPVALARTLPSTGRVAATARDVAGDVGILRQTGRDILESAAQAPGRFLGTEAAFLGASAAGGGAAEAVSPGSATARLIGEVAPTLSPALIASRVIPNTVNKLLDITSGINPLQAKGRASARLQEIAKQYPEEDLELLSKTLMSDAANEVDGLTAAQMTDSPMLNALENTLIKESKVAGEAYKIKAKESAEKINDLYRQALLGGDSSQIFLAAQARKEYLTDLLENRVARADQKARQLLGPVESARPKSEVSIEARNIIESALADARATERSLWEVLPKDIDVVPTNLSTGLRQYKSEILDERMLPSPTEAFARRVARVEQQDIDDSLVREVFADFDLGDVLSKADRVTTGDLLDFREVALRKARQLRSGANPDYDTARIMQGLADSALDDLSVIPGNQVDVARSFSRELNDKFSRTFAADILGITSRGRVRIEPELTLSRTMQGGGPQAEVRARQLEEAVAPIQTDATNEMLARPKEMRQAQQDFLFSMANAVRNPRTQEFDAARLSKFMADNTGNIERLGMTNTFKDMQSARKAFETSLSAQKSASAFFDKKKVAGRILKVGEQGIDKFVSNIINNSNTKAKDLRDLFRLVSGNPDALKGLRTSIFENIIDNGYDPVSGVLTGARIKDYLGKAFAGGETLKQALLKSGAMTEQQMRRVDMIAAQADKFTNAIKGSGNVDDLFKDQGPISYVFSMMTRTLGARLGATSPMAKGSGATLVFASEGRKAAEKVFNILPKTRTTDVLVEAAITNPKLMAELLQTSKPGTARRIKSLQQIEAYLIQAGIIDKESEE
jgi:hypothetical protein